MSSSGQPPHAKLSVDAWNAPSTDCVHRTRRNGTTTPALPSRVRTSPSRQESVSSAAVTKNVGRHRSYTYAACQSGRPREPDHPAPAEYACRPSTSLDAVAAPTTTSPPSIAIVGVQNRGASVLHGAYLRGAGSEPVSGGAADGGASVPIVTSVQDAASIGTLNRS